MNRIARLKRFAARIAAHTAGRTTLTLVAASAAALVTACGGGGSDNDAAGSSSTAASTTRNTAAGIYRGSISGSTPVDVQMIVLDNGEVWSLYGTQTASQFLLAGFLNGSSNWSATGFNSTDLRDYFGLGTGNALLGMSATYDATGRNLRGSFSSRDGWASFTSGALAGSLYVYNTPALLSTVQGAWTLNNALGVTTALTVAADGTLTALTSAGCSYTGKLTPRASGVNVFDATATFGAAPCALPAEALTGIAVAYPLSNGTTQLILALRNAARTVGTAGTGVR